MLVPTKLRGKLSL